MALAVLMQLLLRLLLLLLGRELPVPVLGPALISGRESAVAGFPALCSCHLQMSTKVLMVVDDQCWFQSR
jgi:hypothetical protein